MKRGQVERRELLSANTSQQVEVPWREGRTMSAAEREAKARWPLWEPTGDLEVDREEFSQSDAEWQNSESLELRRAFVAGAEWQAEQHKTVLDAVSELHRPARLVRGDSEFCHECTDPWPCRTARALEERTDT